MLILSKRSALCDRYRREREVYSHVVNKLLMLGGDKQLSWRKSRSWCSSFSFSAFPDKAVGFLRLLKSFSSSSSLKSLSNSPTSVADLVSSRTFSTITHHFQTRQRGCYSEAGRVFPAVTEILETFRCPNSFSSRINAVLSHVSQPGKFFRSYDTRSALSLETD